jgi:hypothetical protein
MKTAIFLTLFLISCGDKEDKIVGVDNFEKEGFPLAIGNTWNYEAWTEVTDPIGTIRSEAEVEWLVQELDVVFDEQAYRMQTKFTWTSGPSEGKSTTGWSWFSIRNDTLYAIASENTHSFDPVSAQLFKAIGLKAQVTQREWGATSFVFPLKIGKSWEYFVGVVENDRKTVVGFEQIEVPAGNFGTFRIARTGSDSLNTLQIDQWVSSIGIVKVTEEISSRISFESDDVRVIQSGMELVKFTVE